MLFLYLPSCSNLDIALNTVFFLVYPSLEQGSQSVWFLENAGLSITAQPHPPRIQYQSKFRFHKIVLEWQQLLARAQLTCRRTLPQPLMQSSQKCLWLKLEWGQMAETFGTEHSTASSSTCALNQSLLIWCLSTTKVLCCTSTPRRRRQTRTRSILSPVLDLDHFSSHNIFRIW